MAVVEFVRIVNPKKDGDVLVLAKRDFDPLKHTLATATAAAASTTASAQAVSAGTPKKSIVDLNAEDAKALVAETDEVPALQVMLEQEQANTKYEGGRKSVIDAIAAKLNPKG